MGHTQTFSSTQSIKVIIIIAEFDHYKESTMMIN